LHRQRALYVLPIWLGNRVLPALSFIYIVQISIIVTFNRSRCQKVFLVRR